MIDSQRCGYNPELSFAPQDMGHTPSPNRAMLGTLGLGICANLWAEIFCSRLHNSISEGHVRQQAPLLETRELCAEAQQDSSDGSNDVDAISFQNIRLLLWRAAGHRGVANL